jgi:hypothetical protein
MRRWLHMRDFWTVKKSSLDFVKKQQDGKDGESLLVRVAATHAGIVNGNMRFYRPDRMMDGVHTWTPKKAYARPVLIGHNESGEVLGRVLDAKYVDESYKYKSEHTQIRDSAFYATDTKKKIDVFKSIDWIVNNLMAKDDYTGLGYVELGLKVTNPAAIEKVIRDEYLTVSVGFKTDAAVCSICHTDWAQDDKCEHKLGETVDGRQMFLISGHFDYEEVSFVNFPADPFASTISKEKLNDNLGKMFFLGLPVRQQSALTLNTGLRFTDSLYAADIQLVEETMADTVVDPKTAAEMATIEEPNLTEDERKAALAEATAAPVEAAAVVEAAASTTVTDAKPPVTEVTDRERIKRVLEKVLQLDKIKGTDINGSEIKGILNDLDKAYDTFEDDKRYMVRCAVSCMLDDWSADSSVEYWMSALAADKDHVLVKKSDVADKDAKVTDLTAKATEAGKKQEDAEKKAASFFLNYKRGLASQIVMHKVLTGATGFTDLTANKIHERVAELSKRDVSSLKDTVSDILSELKWSDKTPSAPREEKPIEAPQTVNDNVTVAEPVPGSASLKEKDNTDEAGAQREMALHLAKLGAMTPSERQIYLADLNYGFKAKK